MSKKRREATVSFADPDVKASEFHGPKPAEVYGFVGSITTVVATGGPFMKFMFLILNF